MSNPKKCVAHIINDKGDEVRCKRPIGTLERDKEWKTCATCGNRRERAEMRKEYVQNYSYALPNTQPYLKEAYTTNEYGEPMFFDTEWIHHDDCGKVKVLKYNGGICMLDEEGEVMVTSLGEMRRMLNLLFKGGAIRELGMPMPEPSDEILIEMGRRVYQEEQAKLKAKV